MQKLHSFRHIQRAVATLTLSFATAVSLAQAITISATNEKLENLFKEVERQTSYRFVYSSTDLKDAKRVSLRLDKAPVTQFLSLCSAGQGFQFRVDNTIIIISPKAQPSAGEKQAERSITGVVVNHLGEAVAGATVSIAGSGISVPADSNGRFQVMPEVEDKLIIVSSVGYNTVETAVPSSGNITIRLQTSDTRLDETVIIAYGTSTRRNSTSSISKVPGKDIAGQPVSNPLAALQGRVPGLFITQANGWPGSNFEVLIRGRNSIQQGTSPLFIVDGVPFLNQPLRQSSLINGNNPLSAINPLDIESIDVLKDADATSIYGSRGANGVILITTKKGKPAGTELAFLYSRGWSRITRAKEYMSTPEYLQMRREAFANDGLTPATSNAADLSLWDSNGYTNWKQEMIGGTASTQNAYVSYAGGNKHTRHTLSTGYYHETTVVPGDFNAARGTLNLAISHMPESKKLRVELSAQYAVERNDLISQDFTNFINLPPNAPRMFDSSGGLRWYEKSVAFNNPFALLVQGNNTLTRRFTLNNILSWFPVDGLTLRVSGGYNFMSLEEESTIPIAAQHPAGNPKGSAQFGNNRLKTWIVEPQAEYFVQLHKTKATFLLGSAFQGSHGINSLVKGGGYTNDALLSSIAAAATITATSNKFLYRYNAVFGRVNLRSHEKYLLQLTGRRDGSSRFGPGRQFALFGSAAAGWIFSEEKWMSKSSVLSFGKLKGSYGTAGNDQINDYQFLQSWSVTAYPYAGQPGFKPTKLFNANYSWEQNRKWEATLELGLWKNRIYLTAGYFNTKTGNQIISYHLPSQTGFSTVLKNFPGLVENRGWELDLQSTAIKQENLQWITSVNITIARNCLREFPGLSASNYSNTYHVGKPLNVLLGYEFLGVSPTTGIYEFRDMNGDGKLNPDDFVYVGSFDPKYYGGFLNSFQWKGFGLEFLFQFVKQMGRDVIYSATTLPGRNASNFYKDISARWQKPGDIAPYQKLTASAASPASAAGRFVRLSSAVFTDASFIRLKTLSLSYDLNKKVLRSQLKTCRIFFQTQNLFTFTGYTGNDPENQGTQALPPLCTMLAGVQVAF